MTTNLGYNHPSLSAISPYLETTSSGPSTQWAAKTALRFHCTVAVGYPEIAADGKIYNALVFLDASGAVCAHYRKTFLYYTDETWACEGQGFFGGELPLGSGRKMVKAAAGICMDINPCKFEAPWTLYEFANHARELRANLIVVSMAWLTRLTGQELSDAPLAPDLDTVGYWIERFRPMIASGGAGEEVILVLANRTGEEGMADRIGEVRYAGSSSVMGLKPGSGRDIRIWNILGRAEEELLVVDTDDVAKYGIEQS